MTNAAVASSQPSHSSSTFSSLFFLVKAGFQVLLLGGVGLARRIMNRKEQEPW